MQPYYAPPRKERALLGIIAALPILLLHLAVFEVTLLALLNA
jgi:hypothetical protein